MYRERLGLSYEQYLQEPADIVEQTMLIWALQAERDKLDSDRSAS